MIRYMYFYVWSVMWRESGAWLVKTDNPQPQQTGARCLSPLSSAYASESCDCRLAGFGQRAGQSCASNS